MAPWREDRGRVSAAAPTFSPSDLANLELWFRGDLCWEDASKTDPADADGDPVYVWDDKALTQDAVQATSTKRPTLKTGANGIGGQPALSFDGAGDTSDLTGIALASGPRTFYVVVNPDSATGLLRYFLDSQTGRLVLAEMTALDGQVGWYDGNWGGEAAATANAQILTYVFGSPNGELFRDGTSLGADAHTQRAIGANTAIGASYAGNLRYFAGLMAEFITYSEAHDSSTRGQVETYLSTRYGISI